MKKIVQKICILFLCLCTLTGCSTPKTQISYTIYPIRWLLEIIGGNAQNLVSVQEDTPIVVQRAQLKSTYKDILENSVAFFHIGTLEPYLTVMGDVSSDLDDEDLSTLNAVYDFERYTQTIVNGESKFIESPYYNGTIFNTIDTTSKDLCLWNDPISMLSMAGHIRDWYIEKYPENEEFYQANYKTLEADLINLDAQYQSFATSLSKLGKKLSLVTMTASFGNWQKTYGFEVYPLILSRYGALPNEEQLQAIEQRIIDDNLEYIVYETNMSEDMITLFDRVSQDCNLTRVDLSNLSSLSDEQEDSGKDYLSIMYENLSVLTNLMSTEES